MGSDGSATSGAEAFTQLLDKALTNEPNVFAWCPTMDLLALGSTDGQVAVHRLIWQPASLQQLWISAPEGVPCSLCWRPDGKALAVGLENGAMVLLHVEDGSVMHRADLHEAAIKAISWFACTPDRPPVSDSAQKMFPPDPEPLPDPAKVAMEPYASIGYLQSHSWPAYRDFSPSLTVSIDCAGVIHICAFGSFSLASLDLFSLVDISCGKEALEVAGVSLSKDLHQLAVLVRQQGPAQGSHSCNVALIDTSILAKRGAELQEIALQATRIMKLLEGAETTLQEASSRWGDAMKQSRAKWTQLERLLADHASSSNPKQELLNLLGCGFPSAALRQFLSSSLGRLPLVAPLHLRVNRSCLVRRILYGNPFGQYFQIDNPNTCCAKLVWLAFYLRVLVGRNAVIWVNCFFLDSLLTGEAGVKRLAKAVDSAVGTIHELLLDHLSPAVELAAFRLGELRGLASCGDWIWPIGLEASLPALAQWSHANPMLPS
eukprot:scaffold154417_cov49-Prasinocladus_malaysianus.AAC.3